MQFRVVAVPLLASVIGAPAVAQMAPAPLTLGQPVQGELTSSDPTSSARSGRADRYSFSAQAGQQVQITMVSEELDTYLYLLDANGTQLAYDDDSLGNLDSRIRHTFGTAGTYTIEATAFSEGLGNYTLAAAVWEPNPISVSTIEVGSTVEGSIDTTDGESQWSGSVDLWEFEAQPGKLHVIEVRSDVLSPTLSLLGPGGISMASGLYGDDGVQAIRSRITEAGTYRVAVYGGYSGAFGPYSLTLNATEVSTTGPRELAIGADAAGELGPSSTVDAWGQAYDQWTLDAPAGRVVRVVLSDAEFDGTLTVLDATGTQLAYADAYSATDGSMGATFTTAEAAEVNIAVRSSYGGYGAYSLMATADRPVEIEPRRARIGQTLTGEVGPSDAASAVGNGNVDVFAIELDAGSRVHIALSSDCGANLRVVAPTGEVIYEPAIYGYGYGGLGGMFGEGEVLREDDAPMFAAAGSFEGVIRATGVHTVAVLTNGGPACAYSLAFAEGTAPADMAALELGATVAGRVTMSDPVNTDCGAPADSFLFRVEDDGRYSISATNTGDETWISPQIVVRGPYGDTHWGTSSSDYTGTSVVADLSAGTYTVVVGSYGSEFDYSLTSGAMEVMPVTVTAVEVGSSTSGSLEASDALGVDRISYVDYYTVALSAGQTVDVTVLSPAFTSSITLYSELGEWLASTDSTYGSPATYTAAAPMQLTIAVGAYSLSNLGGYTLNVTAQAN